MLASRWEECTCVDEVQWRNLKKEWRTNDVTILHIYLNEKLVEGICDNLSLCVRNTKRDSKSIKRLSTIDMKMLKPLSYRPKVYKDRKSRKKSKKSKVNKSLQSKNRKSKIGYSLKITPWIYSNALCINIYEDFT